MHYKILFVDVSREKNQNSVETNKILAVIFSKGFVFNQLI